MAAQAVYGLPVAQPRPYLRQVSAEGSSSPRVLPMLPLQGSVLVAFVAGNRQSDLGSFGGGGASNWAVDVYTGGVGGGGTQFEAAMAHGVVGPVPSASVTWAVGVAGDAIVAEFAGLRGIVLSRSQALVGAGSALILPTVASAAPGTLVISVIGGYGLGGTPYWVPTMPQGAFSSVGFGSINTTLAACWKVNTGGFVSVSYGAPSTGAAGGVMILG